ncbi:MAG: hypothetical protein AABX11_05610 [Nanoarchaeota archaeon]
MAYKGREHEDKVTNLTKWGSSMLIPTAISYVAGMAYTHYIAGADIGPAVNSVLSFLFKTEVYYATSVLSYWAMHRERYNHEGNQSLKRDIGNKFKGNMLGTVVTTLGAGVQWGMMDLLGFGPKFSFLVGSVIGGGLGFGANYIYDKGKKLT